MMRMLLMRAAAVLGVSLAGVTMICAAEQAVEAGTVDEREAFAASFFYGYAMDTFAADELNRYLNPDDSGDVEERFVGGFDFEYRFRGQKGGRGWWIYGETLHGVRSADIDCAAPENEGLSPCTESGFDPNNPGEQTLYILRNATSLEAFIGFRYEFLPFNRRTNHPATLYAALQFGFMTVSDNAGDVVDNRHGGLGMMLTSGRFAGSYLEVGFGTNDLFLENSNRRYMIDGFITFESALLGKLAVRPFAQMTCDFDMDRGSDSIQSYFGLDFDLDRLFGRDEG